MTLRFLDAMADAGFAFVVLHGEDSIESVTGDLDIVADQAPSEILNTLTPAIAPMVPIVVCAYEPGGSKSVFLATPDLSEGAQVDILFDPRGQGSLGFRSLEMMRFAQPGDRYPTLRRDAQLAYLIRKRVVKAQADRLPALVGEATECATFKSVVEATSTARAESGILRALCGEVPDRPVRPPISLPHLADRLARPVGAWIACPTDAMARELARRAARVLPTALSDATPAKLAERLGWWARKVEPVRLRPGIVATSPATHRSGPQPDLILDRDQGIEEAVRWLADRTARRITQ